VLGATRRQFLANYAQGQELVTLQAQDRAEAHDIGGREQAIATCCAPRSEQLLVLQVADLRDRDVGELTLELLADGADREGLASPAGSAGLSSVLDAHRSLSAPGK